MIHKGIVFPVYLVYGEDTVTVHEEIKKMIPLLLQNETSGSGFFDCEIIPEEQLTAQRIQESLQTLSLFQQRRIVWLKDVDCLSGKTTTEGKDSAEMLAAWFAGSQDLTCIVIITASSIDQRRAFFQCIKKYGVVVHIKILEINHHEDRLMAARLVKERLKKAGKTIAAETLNYFLEAFSRADSFFFAELEKLILNTGESSEISLAAVKDLVIHNLEIQLYECNDAVGTRSVHAAIALVKRLLDNGVFPLVLITSLQNYFRSLMVCRSFLERYAVTISEGKNGYFSFKSHLEQLKTEQEASSDMQALLAQSPYALYKKCAVAQTYTARELQKKYIAAISIEKAFKQGSVSPTLAVDLLVTRLMI